MRSIALHSVAAAFMYVTPLAVFVPAAFISAGLKNGRGGAWGAIAGTAVLLTLLSALTVTTGMATRMAGLARLLLEIGLPAALATALIRRRTPIGTVLLATIGISAAGFGVSELALRGSFHYSPYETLVSNFRQQASSTIDLYRASGVSEDVLGTMKRAAGAVAESYMPLFMISISSLMFALSLIILPRLPIGRETNGLYLYRNLSFPEPLLFAFVVGGLAPLADGVLRVTLFNLLGLVVFLYFLQGLAVFRFTILRLRLRILGNVIAWGTLTLLALNGVALFLLFLVGLFDPFFDFRKLNRKEASDESHPD